MNAGRATAALLIEIGDFAAARVEMDQVLDREPVPPAIRVKNAELLRWEGRPQAAAGEPGAAARAARRDR